MPLINWNSTLETGHPQIDAEHRRLVEIVNRLNDAMLAGRGQDELSGIFDDLAAYTRTHFTAEEAISRRAGYEGHAEHKQLHEELLAKVSELQGEFQSGKSLISMSLMRFLREWLSEHIQKEDRKVAEAALQEV